MRAISQVRTPCAAAQSRLSQNAATASSDSRGAAKTRAVSVMEAGGSHSVQSAIHCRGTSSTNYRSHRLTPRQPYTAGLLESMEEVQTRMWESDDRMAELQAGEMPAPLASADLGRHVDAFADYRQYHAGPERRALLLSARARSKSGISGLSLRANPFRGATSGRQDLNLRPLGPEPSALPD